MTTALRVFSFGGGVQSTAALVLAAQGRIDFRTFLFCNVGDQAENPATLEYVSEYAGPYAQRHGIELIELQDTFKRGERAGKRKDLYEQLTRPGSRSIGIPVRMSNGAPARRACTTDYKVRVVGRWTKERGASEANPAVVGIGFSLDEIERAGSITDPRMKWQVKEYPLLPLHLNRSDCMEIIRSAGLPVPAKSACWFCPFHSPQEWQRLQREEPEQFEKAAALEELLNDRRKTLGKDAVWFTRFAMPLREAFSGGVQLDMFTADGDCDSGYCWR